MGMVQKTPVAQCLLVHKRISQRSLLLHKQGSLLLLERQSIVAQVCVSKMRTSHRLSSCLLCCASISCTVALALCRAAWREGSTARHAGRTALH
jgi:hypothetical protein